MSFTSLRMLAGRVYLLIAGVQSFLWALAFTLGLVYQVQVAHLNPLQLVLVGTVLEATCFVAEIPTGLVADLYSRRTSVIIGLALIGFGVLLVGSWASFWPILLGHVVWGIGYTFTSGATEAWITDEVGEDAVQHYFTRAEQLGLVGTFTGTLAAGALGVLDVQWPTIIGGMLFLVLAALLVVVMPENGFAPAPKEERSSFAHMGVTIKAGLCAARNRGVVRAFMVIALLTGMGSEVFDRLWVDRVLSDFPLPSLFGWSGGAVWFTVFALISSVLSLLASRLANRFARTALTNTEPRQVMALLMGCQVLGVAGFALAPWLWGALGFRWLREAAVIVGAPVRRTWLNRHISPSARATTLSMMSQADAIGQVVGGPALGGLAVRTSVVLALLGSAAVQSPAVVLLLRLRPSGHERSEQEASR